MTPWTLGATSVKHETMAKGGAYGGAITGVGESGHTTPSVGRIKCAGPICRLKNELALPEYWFADTGGGSGMLHKKPLFLAVGGTHVEKHRGIHISSTSQTTTASGRTALGNQQYQNQPR